VVPVCTPHEFIVLSFLSFALVQYMPPRRSQPKEEDDIMAAGDCGRVTAILYSRFTTRLRSLGIILPVELFTSTPVHGCNSKRLLTISIPLRPDAGVWSLRLPMEFKLL
jgi:hypothetical protein